MFDRKEKMKSWLKSLGYDLASLEVASEDASFRRYFRIQKQSESFIVMDAPPENESCDAFIFLATCLTSHGINAPQIFEQNLTEGFLVLSDFGDDLLLGLLNQESVDALYQQAMRVIDTMQTMVPCEDVPFYAESKLIEEMDLFKAWFIERLLGITLNSNQEILWSQAKKTLIQSALEQPQYFVHRDFHSRNLIKTPEGDIGIIDFQDAVKGPVTYDLVSLLRDCYVAWPAEQVNQWVSEYYKLSKERLHVGEDQFHYWFNLMGVQRHLKAIGIFSRLKLRDDKHGYIADIPRTLSYIEQVCLKEPSLSSIKDLISELSLSDKINRLVEQ